MSKMWTGSVLVPGLFKGKVALVTGGGTGIGRAIASELAVLGACVIIAGRRIEPLQTTCQEIESRGGGSVDFVQLNIRNQEEVHKVIGQLVQKYKKIDMLVNNAGGQFLSPAGAIKPKGWNAVIDTNLNGTWWVTHACYDHWMRDHGGSIVTIVADVRNGFPMMAHTGAARAGLINLTKTLAVEWAQFGIRINAVAPGVILSSGMKNYPVGVQDSIVTQARGNPSSRAGTEAEVSSGVCFLLSDGAQYITGINVKIDGGSSLSKVQLSGMQQPHDKIERYHGLGIKVDAPAALVAKL